MGLWIEDGSWALTDVASIALFWNHLSSELPAVNADSYSSVSSFLQEVKFVMTMISDLKL